MNELAVFFCDSNKRLANLQKLIETECPESAHTRLKKQCTTRWVEKQTAVFVFKELYPAVVASLTELSMWPGETGGKATLYLRALDQNFLIAMEVLNSVLAVTKPLSVKLQGVSQDIHSAITSINGCIEVLETYREGQKFEELLRNVEKETGTIEMPRIVSKQRHRYNAPATSPSEHYKRNLFYPFVDTCISQLRERFSTVSQNASMLSRLIPAFCCDKTYETIKESVNRYR
jgi:hypothetical protein